LINWAKRKNYWQ